jgi:heme/copper-type cytochrome/quinol oxidase subunit 2
MMMKQTKTTIATWAVAGILVAGLLVFGCKRQAGHMEQDERGGGAPHEEGGMGSVGHADEVGHGHHDSNMVESMHAAELTGKLSNGVRVIELKARKFAFDPATIIVKQGEKIRLRVTSEDVMHGIGIADYDIDRKLPPNETQVIEFTAGKAGKHYFYCSVYCGSGHGDMRGELVVLP